MESLQRSLEVLNNLNGVDLARMIWEQGPPPVGWAMDVYMSNGEIYFSDYYTVGTIIEYEPDVVVIATIDNRLRRWDPVVVYTVGYSWALSDELMDKYRDYFEEDLPEWWLQYRIWTELAKPEEQDKEYARMLDWLWHGEHATLEWLYECIVDAISEIEARLLEKEEVQEK